MGLWGALRNVLRPLSARSLILPSHQLCRGVISPLPVSSSSRAQPASFVNPLYVSPLGALFSTSTTGSVMTSLTDTRFPKRRPGMRSRRKRASLKPPGPHAWVQYVPGEPIPRSRPNEGSVQGRNRIKRIKQRKAFILVMFNNRKERKELLEGLVISNKDAKVPTLPQSEKKKRKAQYAAFRKKRDAERIERKMAAVAREKAWAERLVELQRMEEEKKGKKTALA